MTSQTLVIGIDVGKDSLSLRHAHSSEVAELSNEERAIKAWLKELPALGAFAIEATGSYYVRLTKEHRVSLIHGYRLSNHRKGIGGRNKHDRSDAQLLARYLAHEQEQLEPRQPPCKGYSRLQTLLHRRCGAGS